MEPPVWNARYLITNQLQFYKVFNNQLQFYAILNFKNIKVQIVAGFKSYKSLGLDTLKSLSYLKIKNANTTDMM